MRKLKAIGLAIMLTGTAMLGDSSNINDKITNPIRYRNVKVDPKTYQQPFKLRKKYVVNEKGMMELQIGHNEKWYLVEKELRVNERTLEQMMKEKGDEFARGIREKYEQKQPIIKEYLNKITEMYKEIFQGGEDGRAGKTGQ
jgi:hypothetical protein